MIHAHQLVVERTIPIPEQFPEGPHLVASRDSLMVCALQIRIIDEEPLCLLVESIEGNEMPDEDARQRGIESPAQMTIANCQNDRLVLSDMPLQHLNPLIIREVMSVHHGSRETVSLNKLADVLYK